MVVATGRHISLQLDAETFERLAAQSRRAGQVPSQLARTFLEEGLRMEAHPGIVFRSGPAGRRAGLAGGPDVWEVVRVYRGLDGQADAALQQTANLTGLPPEAVRAAIAYYAEYPEEIDDWIRRLDATAAEAEAAWQRAQSPPER